MSSMIRMGKHPIDAALKRHIIEEVVPRLAGGLLAARRRRGGTPTPPTDAELRHLLQQALALLFHGRSDDLDRVSPRQWGSLYESLLGYRLKITDGKPGLTRDQAGRKATGSFYTPDHIVRYIVKHTVGPALARHLAGLGPGDADGVEKLFDFKIIDPAMGSGHFLVAAAAFIAAELHQFLIARNQPADIHQIKRRVLERCIYGIDSDPLVAELAKLSLGGDATGDGITALEAHLRVGDTLAGALAPDANQFDAILCNPPYSGHKGDVDAAALAGFAVCRRYPNSATAFCELATRLCKPGGWFGLIVPKSIQYVEAWQDARQLLAEQNALDRLLDASQAFEDVLLEQTILIGRKAPPENSYLGGMLLPNGPSAVRALPRKLSHSLPAAVEPESLDLLDHISPLGPRLGDISITSQALGYQAKLNCGDPGQAIGIHRGRQIRPMRIDPATDWIARAGLIKPTGEFTPKVAAMLRPKVVTQNIIAHLTRPRPRLWIIAAPDLAGILCLNTISTTIMSDQRFPIEYIAAVLNSTLASWFYSEFVFCRAVRTMHFDNYYAGQLPIAVPSDAIVQDCRALANRCAAADSRGERQQMIDAIVFRAYQLSEQQQAFLRRYCYGRE